jgi:Na+/proline symporter
MLSTIDGFLLAGAQATTWDIFDRKRVAQILSNPSQADQDDTALTLSNDERTVINHAKLAIFSLAILGTGAVYYLNVRGTLSLYSIVYITYSAQIVLLPTILCILLKKEPSRRNGFLSIALGLVSGLGCSIYALTTDNNELLTWSPIIGLVVALIFVLRSFLAKKAR